MANLLSAAEFKAITPVALSDSDLDTVIERVEAEITAEIGVPYTAGLELTETIRGEGGDLFLMRPISAIVSVTEYDTWIVSDATAEALTADEDFIIWHAQGRLERLQRACWAPKIVVVYTPTDQTKLRKAAIIDLTRIALAYSAYQSESVGNAEYTYRAPASWEASKAAIMDRLRFDRY